MRINLVKRLNSRSNPSYNTAQNEENDYSKNISPNSFGKTANKSNNGGGTYHPEYKSDQPFSEWRHAVIIAQQNIQEVCRKGGIEQ